MKKVKIVILVLVTLMMLFVNINSIFNNLLNKKYIVNEISTTNNQKGLEGIQNSINLDYASFRWVVFINSIFLIFLFIYVMYLSYKLFNDDEKQ